MLLYFYESQVRILKSVLELGHSIKYTSYFRYTFYIWTFYDVAYMNYVTTSHSIVNGVNKDFQGASKFYYLWIAMWKNASP